MPSWATSNSRERLAPLSLRDRLRRWDKLLLQLGLSLQCSPTMLEHLPTAQVQAMADNLNDILSSRKG